MATAQPLHQQACVVQKLGSMLIEHELYLQLLAQAHAVATYLDPNTVLDARDVLERAADHVAALAGFRGAGARDVAAALCQGLLVKRRQPQRYEICAA